MKNKSKKSNNKITLSYYMGSYIVEEMTSEEPPEWTFTDFDNQKDAEKFIAKRLS